MRRLAWRAASGGTAATSPPRSSMGERRKWRPVRRARAADERMTSGTSTSECSGCLFCPRSVRGRIPGNGATAKKDAARELFWGDTDDRLRAWHGRARPRPAGAGRRSAAYGRVQAPEQCCRCPDRVKARAGAENGKEASGRIGAGGSGGRWVSQAGDSVLRVPYGPGCVWPVGSQGSGRVGRIGAGGSGGRWVSQAGDSVLRVPYGPGCVWPVGSDRHAAPRAGRNRGSGSKALGT